MTDPDLRAVVRLLVARALERNLGSAWWATLETAAGELGIDPDENIDLLEEAAHARFY